jgi:hypothetical protein
MQTMHMSHTISSPSIGNWIVENGLSKIQNMCMCFVTLLDFSFSNMYVMDISNTCVSLHLVLQKGYIIFSKIKWKCHMFVHDTQCYYLDNYQWLRKQKKLYSPNPKYY